MNIYLVIQAMEEGGGGINLPPGMSALRMGGGFVVYYKERADGSILVIGEGIGRPNLQNIPQGHSAEPHAVMVFDNRQDFDAWYHDPHLENFRDYFHFYDNEQLQEILHKINPEDSKIISPPSGFKKIGTGSDYYAFIRQLSDGRVIMLFGDDNKDMHELPPSDKDPNVACMYRNQQDAESDQRMAEDVFRTESQLHNILKKWIAQEHKSTAVTVTREETEDGRRQPVEILEVVAKVDGQEYVGTVREDGDGISVDWWQEPPPNWEDIEEFLMYPPENYWKFPVGQSKTFFI